MVVFRSPKKQATQALKPLSAIGTSRHKAKLDGKSDGLIFSYGTLRNYTQALTTCASWYSEQGHLGRVDFGGTIKGITPDQAREYLKHRATLVGQKQLDLDRQALEKVLGLRLGRLKSLAESPNRLATRPRAYSDELIEQIAAHQSPENSLATLVAASAGLRAHELFTLGTPEEQPASRHREFHHDRFAGRDAFRRYTVVGKGGLTREVGISDSLSDKLNNVRIPQQKGAKDRGIWYQQRYAIGAGQRWSQSFTEASLRVAGWSRGAHGVRHSHAQSRLEQLQAHGFQWEEALRIVSEELGHFRSDVTLTYLR